MVEEMTRSQADSKLWFQQRVGWITASTLHNVLLTDCSQPSVSIFSQSAILLCISLVQLLVNMDAITKIWQEIRCMNLFCH